MKVPLDTCVWGKSQAGLRAERHDVIWAGDWPHDPGDEAILARAHAEERVLVTLDKDFGTLATLHGMPHHGIVRLVNVAARRQAAVCLQVLNTHGGLLLQGAIITVEAARLRIRPPDRPKGELG